MLQMARKGNATGAPYTTEVLGKLKSRAELGLEHSSGALSPVSKYTDFAQAGLDKMTEWSGKLFGAFETYGRESTFMTAFKVFRNEKNFSKADAYKAAIRFTVDTHMIYGKSNTPLFMSEGVGKLIKIPYIFRAYEHNYLQMLGNLYSDKGGAGKLAALKSLAYLGAMGGGPALPFFGAAFAGYRAVFGDSPEVKARQVFDKVDNSGFLSNMVLYGVPGMIGTSLQGSMKVAGDQSLSEMLGGAAGSSLTDSIAAFSAAKTGDWETFATKMLPAVIANPVKAYEGWSGGLLSSKGSPIRERAGGEPMFYTPKEALLQSFGFSSTRKEMAGKLTEAKLTEKEHFKGEMTRIMNLMERGMRRGNDSLITSAFEKMQAYNEKAMGIGPDVPLLTPKAILSRLSEKPKLKEMLIEQRLLD
ncbi:hypothetical protein CCP1ISM_1710001 [Azospirillaceae bacterium]